MAKIKRSDTNQIDRLRGKYKPLDASSHLRYPTSEYLFRPTASGEISQNLHLMGKLLLSLVVNRPASMASRSPCRMCNQNPLHDILAFTVIFRCGLRSLQAQVYKRVRKDGLNVYGRPKIRSIRPGHVLEGGRVMRRQCSQLHTPSFVGRSASTNRVHELNNSTGNSRKGGTPGLETPVNHQQ